MYYPAIHIPDEAAAHLGDALAGRDGNATAEAALADLLCHGEARIVTPQLAGRLDPQARPAEYAMCAADHDPATWEGGEA